MNIEITNQRPGKGNTSVSFRADGVLHSAIVYPKDSEFRTESKVFAYGKPGDDVVTTHRIDNPEMLAAVIAAIEA